MSRRRIAGIAVVLGSCGSSGSTVTVVPGAAATSAPASGATSAPVAAATDVPATVAKVGDRVELNGMALTVVKAERKAQLGDFIKAKEGNEFIVTEILIENVSADKVSYNLLYFKAKDTDGFEYTTALGMDQPLSAGDLAKGEKARGNVAFEVKKAAKGLVMEYKPLVFGESEAIRVALE